MPDTSRLPHFEYQQRLGGGFEMPCRMTVLPLGAGRVALVSPIPIDDSLAGRIAELGQVAFLIAPNLLHHLYLGPASQRYPDARVLAPAGLRKKRPDLRVDADLEAGLPPELAEAVQALKIEGAPSVDEHVFFHRAQRALVVTELVFNLVHPRGFWANLVMFLVGCHGRLAQSRAWHFLIRDRPAAAASIARVLALPFDQLYPAHGDLVLDQARPQLAAALAHRLPRQGALPAPR